MNTKNELIEKLLRVAKRHKILTYPVLALVAVISFFCNFFNWRNGTGKRIVAVVMAMVLFVSQSYFLTSSATSLVDTEADALIQQDLQGEEELDLLTVEKEPEETTSNVDVPVAAEEENTEAAEESSVVTDMDTALSPAGEDVTSSGEEDDISVAAEAADDGDDTEDPNEDKRVKHGDITFQFHRTSMDGNGQLMDIVQQSITVSMTNENKNLVNNDGTYTCDLTSQIQSVNAAMAEAAQKDHGCYSYSQEWYYDQNGSRKVDNARVEFPKDNRSVTVNLYPKLKLEKYQVRIVNKCGSENINERVTITGTTGEGISLENNVFYLDALEGGEYGRTFEFTVNATGYKLRNGGQQQSSFQLSVTPETGNVKVSNLMGSMAYQEVVLNWDREEYEITYNVGGKIITQKVHYDGSETYYTLEDLRRNGADNIPEGATEVVGYQNDTYTGTPQIQGGVTPANKVADGQDGEGGHYGRYQKGTPTVLYPVFGYAGIKWNIGENDSGSTYTASLNYTYATEADKQQIYATYKNSNSSGKDFEYTVLDEDKAKLAEYGIELIENDVGFTIAPQKFGPKKVTNESGVTLNIEVEDKYQNNNGLGYQGGAEFEAKLRSTLVVTIHIKKLTLNVEEFAKNLVTTDGKKSLLTKVYDGTTNCKAGLKDQQFDSGLRTIGTADKPNGDPIKLKVTKAEYTSKDAGVVPIRLTAEWILDDGIKENYECITQIDGINGEITQRPLFVKTYALKRNSMETMGENDYVRAGEQNPPFKVELDTENNNAIDTGVVNTEITQITEDMVEFSTNRGDDLLQEGTYKINVTSAKGLGNYQLAFAEKSIGTFRVYMEYPDEHGSDPIRYDINGEIGQDDWYYQSKPTIKPLTVGDSSYTDIYLAWDAAGTDLVEGSGQSVMNIPEVNKTKKPLYVQLRDSNTGAVTHWSRLDANVDIEAPEYYSYTLSDGEGGMLEDSSMTAGAEGGLYFPSGGITSFGSYFNRTVRITVKFKDTMSGAKTLKYGLFGDKVESLAVSLQPTGEPDIYGASIELPRSLADSMGTITLQAEDIAGNQGETIKLVNSKGSDQWAVETTGPQIESFSVNAGGVNENMVIQIPSGDSRYYTKCKAVVTASDQFSGVRSVTWHIQNNRSGNREEVQLVENQDARHTRYTFERAFPESGTYTVWATVTDTAGNTAATARSITFNVDQEAPIVKILTKDYNKWQSEAKIEFTVYDAISGIDYINIVDENGNVFEHEVESQKEGVYYCSFVTDKKGIYRIVAVDKAGNVNTDKDLTIDLTKVSSDIPECPSIIVNPQEPDGLDDWYSTVPTVTIGNVTKTNDGTMATTQYQLLTQGGVVLSTTKLPGSVESAAVEWPGDGIYTLRVWSESQAGVLCEGNHNVSASSYHDMPVKIDTRGPVIDFTTKGSGASQTVNYTVKDYTGYTNDVSGVKPDSIKVIHDGVEMLSQIKKTENGYEGSFEITKTGSYVIEASDVAGNVTTTSAYTPMSMKVRAVTNITAHSATLGATVVKGTFDIANASISYRRLGDGSYREAQIVSTKDSAGNVAVSTVLNGLAESTSYAYKITAVSELGEVLEYVGYFKTLSSKEGGIYVTGTARYEDEDVKGPITVGLFDGNVCIMAVEVEAGDSFTFTNVPDGNYSIVATDGRYSKTKRVLVSNGMIVYPESMIELILSGKNTSVVIVDDDTPNITADNIDSIFTNDTENFTQFDHDLIDAGGTVEFKLYASLMRVTTVSPDEIAAMYMVTDRQKIVGAYLDLSLYKFVTDEDGNTERTQVHQLTQGANVSVTIPLGDLAGKPGLEVVRIHDTGDRFVGTSLQDMDSNPNTYTITTTQFSTYAVLYDPVQVPQQPPTTADVGEGGMGPAQDGNIHTDEKVTTETTESGISGKTPSGTSGSSIGTLRSSGSAKTGDEAPIAVFGFVLVISAAGFVVIRKKYR